MKEVNVKSVRNFTEEIGSEGAEMEIRMEKSGEAVKVHAKVLKDGKEVAFASREENGQIILSIKKADELTGEEYLDVFHKTALCIAELAEIELPEESDPEEETE